MSHADTRAALQKHFYEIMKLLRLDVDNDDSLQDTPMRLAKMYLDELFVGLQHANYPRMMAVKNTMKYNQILVERNITVKSVCEHHFQPIIGVAHVAYIPKDKVLGLSKFNRLVEYYSRRPQVQERLTEDIHKALVKELGTEDVAVIVDAKHYCVIMRGVNDHGSSTVSSKLSGAFKTMETRNELMDLIKLSPSFL